MPGRLMVGRQVLALVIGVRIPARQPFLSSKTNLCKIKKLNLPPAKKEKRKLIKDFVILVGGKRYT